MMYRREGKKTLASSCRHLVYVQDQIFVPDEEGGTKEGWARRRTPNWAAIWPIRAEEREEMKTHNVHATHKILLRGRVDIGDAGRHRIIRGGRAFRVKTVEDYQERGVLQVCMCEEIR